ncbi:MAG: hypothetical protein JRH20_24465, partial [Deltaproteobacteria bacterium]|nr:hypothetical protein [Deltaproteobacteria bacterium]
MCVSVLVASCTRLGFDNSPIGLTPASDSSASEFGVAVPPVDQRVVDQTAPDARVDSGAPDANVDSAAPDANVDSATPDANVDSTTPDANVDSTTPDASVDSTTPDANVDSTTPDASVDSGVALPTNLSWASSIGGSAEDTGYGVVMDESGNSTITGSFTGTVDFGGGPLTSAGFADVFVASYTPSGAHRWSKRFGSTGYDKAYGIAVDGGANVTITGYFAHTASFGGAPLTSEGLSDVFVASYDSTGTHRWSAGYGGLDNVMAEAVAADGSGNIYVTGTFQDTARFGGA